MQVAPAEVEDVVREVPGVADCAVLGVEDARAGQVGRIAVNCRSSADAWCPIFNIVCCKKKVRLSFFC